MSNFIPWVLRGCLVYVLKQQFSIFKQHFTHFNALFHPHVFLQIFLNNNFQFLNTHTKRALNDSAVKIFIYFWIYYFFNLNFRTKFMLILYQNIPIHSVLPYNNILGIRITFYIANTNWVWRNLWIKFWICSGSGSGGSLDPRKNLSRGDG